MDKVKEQLYEALRDIRENNAGSNERARGWYNAPDALAAYEQEKAAQPLCPACANGQNLERGEGTHLEGTAEHPRHEFVGAPGVICTSFTCSCPSCVAGRANPQPKASEFIGAPQIVCAWCGPDCQHGAEHNARLASGDMKSEEPA